LGAVLQVDVRLELLGQADQHFGRTGVQAGPVLEDDLNLFHGSFGPPRLDSHGLSGRRPGKECDTQVGCLSPRCFRTTSGSRVLSNSARVSSRSITSARLAKTPTCSSALAAMPMTIYTLSPSSHSTPPVNCSTEMPVFRICSRFS